MSKENPEFLHRSSLILWSAFLFSQSTFIFVLYFAKPELFKLDSAKPFLSETPVVVIIFGFIAILNIFISLFLKRQSVERAIEEQDPKILQTGLVMAGAFCESVSILGIVLAFGFGYQYFFLWFVLATIGIILNFPKRQHYHEASFRKL